MSKETINAAVEIENKLRSEEKAQKIFDKYRKFLPTCSQEEQKKIIKEAYSIMEYIVGIYIRKQDTAKKSLLIK